MRIKRLARRLRSLIAPRRPAPLILAYHRIARPRVDPWRLSVSPERFREQLRSIKASRLPMSMSEVAARIEARDLPPTAVALTFDDGYRDNLLVAKPILVEEEVPATIFLSTGAIDARCEFWWDELARLVLDRQASADCQVPLPGGPLHLRLPAVPAHPPSARGCTSAPPSLGVTKPADCPGGRPIVGGPRRHGWLANRNEPR